ncbi:hypothetical protein ACJ41O_013088 [Fusarium nematophilum]
MSKTTTELRQPQLSIVPSPGAERNACLAINPPGPFIRPPPRPHLLSAFITPDDNLFQTIHMGTAVVDPAKWLLVVEGLVRRPFALTLDQLKSLPRTSVTAFHECYGSPVQPPIHNVWRIGNVKWTGVRLSAILSLAEPLPEARFVWSEGLDHGKFFKVEADRYQKDLTIQKAQRQEVLVAFEMNGQPLEKERGGPVRLVVPGWFGTNSTKWLSKLSLQDRRAPSPYTTTLYNEKDPTDPEGKRMRPVWEVEINSMIVKPAESAVVKSGEVEVEGWAWSYDGVADVSVSIDDGLSWIPGNVDDRVEQSWQRFVAVLQLDPGEYVLVARATSMGGFKQPLERRRNHVHRVTITVEAEAVSSDKLG